MTGGVATGVGVGSVVVTEAGEVAGVMWYELGFKRLRDERHSKKEKKECGGSELAPILLPFPFKYIISVQ